MCWSRAINRRGKLTGEAPVFYLLAARQKRWSYTQVITGHCRSAIPQACTGNYGIIEGEGKARKRDS